MIKTSNKEKISMCEFLLVIYCYSFSFAKPVTTMMGGLSVLVLLAIALVILGIYLLHNKISFNKENLLRFLVFFVCVLVFFGLQILFARSSTLYTHIYNFCIYGFIPIFLLINVEDYSKVLKYWCYISTLAGFLFLLDPFVGYRWSGGYMPLGFNHILPAFASSIVLWLHYKKKWAILSAIILFVDMLLYTNKGSPITAIIFFLIFFLFMRKKKVGGVKTMLTVLGLALIALIVVIFRFELFEIFYDLANELGVSSYSLNTFRKMLYSSGEGVYSLRTDIWRECMTEFASSPIFGIGIGGFQAKYSYYPHNIFLEVLVASGIFAFLFFAVETVRSIFFVITSKNEKQIFLIMLLVLWIAPMQISLCLWSYTPFWLFFGMFMYRPLTKSINKETLS